MNAPQLAVLGALAAARTALPRDELVRLLASAGVSRTEAATAVAALASGHLVHDRGGDLEVSSAGIVAFLDAHAALEAALAPNSPSTDREECPSLPWLTTVQTEWIDAVSLNYAVDPAALAPLLPAPLVPEVHKGSAWVQVLVSSLRDMRPQGLGALFGVCFYQVSYRAAVVYATRRGERRGGYFVRSDTNHPVMRTIGNTLVEFKFHDFGLADIVMLRDGSLLTIGVDPTPECAGGKLVALVDTEPLAGPPPGSVWASIDELHEPLVECYDALGIDGEYVYVLTIDREPWRPRFVRPVELYCEFIAGGPLRPSARLDSVLHIERCAYRWRPLRRERLSG